MPNLPPLNMAAKHFASPLSWLARSLVPTRLAVVLRQTVLGQGSSERRLVAGRSMMLARPSGETVDGLRSFPRPATAESGRRCPSEQWLRALNIELLEP